MKTAVNKKNFRNLNDFAAMFCEAEDESDDNVQAAIDRDKQLTKPPGSLGRLEQIACWYAGWRGDADPGLLNPKILLFAGNHGVARKGTSAYPSDVTSQMVANFEAGGAAINQIAVAVGATLEVYPIELDTPTMDISEGPAMSEDEAVSAMSIGWNAVSEDTGLLVIGEMGIGNTTCASAICSAMFGGDAESWVGRGTGISDERVRHKVETVRIALKQNISFCKPRSLRILQALGGRELIAMAGAAAKARFLRIPVLLDGFVCCAAVAPLLTVRPDALSHMLAGHRSAEAAHGRLLERLGMEPLLNLDMRLGEGSGAALAVGIVKSALACHSGMATFDEAGVSERGA